MHNVEESLYKIIKLTMIFLYIVIMDRHLENPIGTFTIITPKIIHNEKIS